MPSVNDILAVVMGGGAGKRLYPLTKLRAKPDVPIAGKYRLIDVPLSNCINSNIHRIAVLTQFNSVSLHRHITQTYNFDAFHPGWVQILAAEQTPTSSDWYQGTADAVRKQLFEIKATRAKYVLILAGDHLYRMDYSPLANFHWQNNAEITVAVQPVTQADASRFGLLKRDQDGRIRDFVEKPQDPEVQARFVSRDDSERPYLGSMGIYMFNTEMLIDVLDSNDFTDFGGQVIPYAIQHHDVYGFDFDGYWVDIGTIRSFYETNLNLTLGQPQFNIYDPQRPIFTRARFLPGSIISGSDMVNVLLADGCRIQDSEISDSVVGLRSIINKGVKIKRTYLMGADYYDPREGGPRYDMPLGIGANCDIEGAIIDKNVRMGEGVVIRPFPEDTELDDDLYSVRDGIVVIPKSTVVPDNTFIGPEK